MGAIRANVAHRKLQAMGFSGDERTTRRAVAEAKESHRAGSSPPLPALRARAGHVAPVRLGEGSGGGRPGTCLFCAWLAWSRLRVVMPTWDKTLGTRGRASTPPCVGWAASPPICFLTTRRQ